MKKAIIYFIMLFVLAATLKAELYRTENPWIIEKQDYMQSYMDYEFVFIDFTTYRVNWKINPEYNYVFDILRECIEIDDDDCVDNKSIKIKNKKGLEESIKYKVKDFEDDFFPDQKLKLKDDVIDLKSKYFPFEKLKGHVTIYGDVNPLYADHGTVYIFLKNGIFNSTGTSFKLGYGSLVTTFNNSLSTENLTSTIGAQFTRYLKVNRYSNVNLAYINFTSFPTVLQCLENNSNSSNCAAANNAAQVDDYCDLNYHEKFFDNDETTAIVRLECTVDGTYSSYWNYTKPYNTTAAYLEIHKTDGYVNYTISSSCFGALSNELRFKMSYIKDVANLYFRFYCWDGAWAEFLGSGDTLNSGWNGIYEEQIYWNITKNLTFPYMEVGTVGGGNEWNYTGILPNTQNQTSNFNGSVNSALNGGNCDCTGCAVVETTNCVIPVLLNFSYGGILQYSSIYLNMSLSSLNVTFYDESTNVLITDRNVTAIFNSVSTSFNTSTDTGNVLVSWADFEDYNIRYYANGYPLRTRTYSYDGSENPTLKLYLANYSSSVNQKFILFDQYGNRVQNAVIVIKKFFIDTGEFDTISNLISNVNGEAAISLVPEIELYRYLVYYNGSLLWNNSNPEGSPVYIDDDDYIINLQLPFTTYELARKLLLISSTLSLTRYTNSSGNITMTITQSENSKVCLRVYNVSAWPRENVSDDCSTANSSSFYYDFNVTKTTNLLAYGLMQYNGVYYVFDSLYVPVDVAPGIKPFSKDYGYDGLFVAFIFLILAFLLFIKYPELAVFGVEIAFIILMYSNVIDIATNKRMLFTVLSLILTIVVASLVYMGGKK